MKKKILMIIVSILIVIGIIFLILFSINNKNNKLSETKIVHNIKFSNLKIKKEKTKYVVSVKLTSNKKVDAEYFNLEFKNKKNKSLAVLSGYIGNIEKGEIKYIDMETEENLKGAYEAIYTVYAE